MKVKMILPALTEAKSPFFRPIKYSLFPPLGLATLAGYLGEGDAVELQDEHVERLALDDEPDLVVIQVYITSASRAYGLADHYRRKGAYVALGGLHVTSLPDEAARHADTVFLGPGEDTWPAFLADFRAGRPQPVYQSRVRTLAGLPPVRRDLIKRNLYLVPNSIVVSRGCPHICDFCYKDAFFEGGRGFYTQRVDAALAEIDRLPGRHLYFLDDHLFGDVHFASALFDGMRGMGRLWQAAGTVQSVLRPQLLEKAAASGLRSLFVGFETLNPDALRAQSKLIVKMHPVPARVRARISPPLVWTLSWAMVSPSPNPLRSAPRCSKGRNSSLASAGASPPHSSSTSISTRPVAAAVSVLSTMCPFGRLNLNAFCSRLASAAAINCRSTSIAAPGSTGPTVSWKPRALASMAAASSISSMSFVSRTCSRRSWTSER
jgi:hypothetical protein